MKKTRVIYNVVRHSVATLDKGQEVLYNGIILDSFKTFETADNKRGEYEQLFLDRRLDNLFKFEVMTSMYYDE